MGKYVKESLSQLVGRTIRQKRLSLRAVQERSGGQIEKSYISRIMTGNVKNITLEKLIALARGLDLDPHVLFDAYCAHPRSSASEAQEVIELRVPEFAALVHKVAVNPKFVEVMEEVVQLQTGEEIAALIKYALHLNERRRGMSQKEESLLREIVEG
ncbi:MAG TPA: helix-turn-helix transcriptional regulator [Blastocatellia bacterium]|jgi:transcriptional regulator with XRE-family HTH domain|nr:helix-turn-helix transcriptional regulator [Blastocatellia bacterium]